ncbi:tetranectin-like protein isoform X2 [Drosophila innubila]|uniref:tetranectin-like protein isoform X2 n=1 Tax=Drosophila innubila TaxID=198719 RepID=UPI00148C29B5|nr:tetranectin-like protein isoform X2 [Drosophila innubila]
MMLTNNLVWLLIVSILLVQESNASCAEWKQLETTCGSYCFKVLRPILDHTKALQSQVNDSKHQTECLMQPKRNEDLSGKFHNITREIDNLNQKLDYLAKTENVEQLQNRLDALEKKLDQKFENIVKLTKSVAVNDGKVLLFGKPFQKIGSKYYYVETTEKVTWFVAAHKCLEYGGHLASIQSSCEVSELNAHLLSNTEYWIDINDLGTEGVYLSATTGFPASYLSWNKIEPNNVNNSEHCVIYNKDYHMNDDNCQVKHRFICEY